MAWLGYFRRQKPRPDARCFGHSFPGDYDRDFVVNMANYTLWRDNHCAPDETAKNSELASRQQSEELGHRAIDIMALVV